MTDHTTDFALDERLRQADPLGRESLPSPAETEAMLGRLLASGPAAGRPRGHLLRFPMPKRPRVLLGSTAGAAALAVVLALAFTAGTTTPAFAVTRHANGIVTVRLVRLSGIAGANQRLAAMGVRARIVKAIDLARDLARYVASVHPCMGQPAGTERTISFDPKRIPTRRMLLFAADRSAHLSLYSATVKTVTLASLPARARARALVRRATALAASARAKGTSAAATTPPAEQQPRANGHVVRVYCATSIATLGR